VAFLSSLQNFEKIISEFDRPDEELLLLDYSDLAACLPRIQKNLNGIDEIKRIK